MNPIFLLFRSSNITFLRILIFFCILWWGGVDTVLLAQTTAPRYIINGGFETPVQNCSPAANFSILNDNEVQGWTTPGAVPAGAMRIVCGVNAGPVVRPIELWTNGYLGAPANGGNQFAEVNAFQNAVLYQPICLEANESVTVGIWHRRRTTATETIVFRLYSDATGAAGTVVGATPAGHVATSAWVQYTATLTNNGTAGLKYIGIFGTTVGVGADPAEGNLIDDMSIVSLAPLVGINSTFTPGTITEGSGTQSTITLSINGTIQPGGTPATVTLARSGTATASDYIAGTPSKGTVSTNANGDIVLTLPAGNYDPTITGATANAGIITIPVTASSDAADNNETATFTLNATGGGINANSFLRVNGNGGCMTSTSTATLTILDAATVSGTLFNDNNGTTGGPNGTPMSAGTTVTLYAANGTTLIATTTTDASGNYSFPNLQPGNYQVGVTPPSGFQNVSSTDGTPANGLTAITVGTANAPGVNFGLNQPPATVADNLINQPPGSPATMPNVLANDTDPNGGTLAPDSITLVAPSGATGIVTDAQGDVTGFTVPGQGTWALNSSTGAVTFTPQAGFTGSPAPVSYTVTDNAGLSSTPASVTINFNPPVTVSGTVYNDNNAGAPDGTPISAGTIVTLYAANGTTVIITTTTDAGGSYSFPGLVPGNYVVGITAPAGFQNVSSTDGTPANGLTAITVGTANAPGVNFGLNQPPATVADNLTGQPPGSPATIPNLLANDIDPNGGTLAPDSITLVAPSGATGIVTDAQGDVTGFTVPGQGSWSLNSTTGALTFTPQAGFTGDPTPITYTVADAAGLTSSPANITIDYNPPITVSGTVYNDNNAGTPDGTPISAGTIVTLYAANGTTVITTTTTDAGGSYSFPGLVPGNYVVGITAPAGFQNVSSTDGTPANGLTAITVGTANAPGVNFGLNQPPAATADNLTGQPPGSPATIPNLLANDTDPNGGTLSPDSITLVAPSGATGVVTDAQGDVTGFTIPGQGTWVLNSATGALTFTPQAGFTGDPTPITYTVADAAGLTSSPANITIDYNPPITVSGTVYNDNNAGTPGGIPMPAGTTVTLYAADGTTVIATTTTDASGNYSFPNVTPGSYQVQVTPPVGFQNVSATDGTPQTPTPITVGAAAISSVDFGVNQPPAVVNDMVQSPTPGTPTIIPNLLTNDTDPNGGTLSPDSINLSAPPGATGFVVDAQGDTTGFTVPGQGTWAVNSTTGAVTFTPEPGFSGDPTPVTYTVTDNAGLTSNSGIIGIDYPPYNNTISGAIRDDNNGQTGGVNGTPLVGVTVTLYAADGTTVLATTVTDATGNYTFPVPAPGDYIIGVTSPAGYINISSTDGSPADGTTPVTAGLTGITGINLGLNQPPVATADNLNNQPPGSPATIPNILGNDSDPNGGMLSADSISLATPSGATGVVTDAQGDVTGFTVPGEGTWSLNSTTGALTFTPDPAFTGSPTPISYSVTDNAGLSGTPASVTIGFNPPVTISGTLYNDNNGGTPGGTPMPAGTTVTLYSADGTTVIVTTTTDASGNYSFSGVLPGNYIVGVTPPAGFQNVGSTDGTPNDGLHSVTVGATNTADVNFGLNEPPIVVGDNVPDQVPGQPMTIPDLLANDSDPNSGTLSPDSITLIAPVGATGFVADAQGDTTGFTVPGEGTWSLNSTTGSLTFTPDAGFNEAPTPVSYAVMDNAGLSSNATNAGFVLPVSWLDFDAKVTVSDVLLSWHTAKEWNNDRFEIEYSTDGSHFNLAGTVKSKGNTSTTSSYSFTHKDASGLKVPLLFYRLKQVDIDGAFAYSRMARVSLKPPPAGVSVYPNPVDMGMAVNVEADNLKEIELYDVSGKKVVSAQYKEGNQKAVIVTGQLPAGMYTIRINGSYTVKLIVK